MANDPLALVRERIKDVDTRMSRATLVLLAVMAVMAFATARAVRDVDRNGLREQFQDARLLARAVGYLGTIEEVEKSDPGRQFFLLSWLFSEQTSPGDQERPSDYWDAASAVLERRRPDAARASVNPAASPESPCLVSVHEQPVATQCEAMDKLARELAIGAEKGYTDAFNISLGTSGVQVPIDLRNWMAIVPLGLLLSICYFFLLRHERSLLEVLARSMVRASADAALIDRVTFPSSTGRNPLDTYSRRIPALLVVLILAVQLRYLIVSWASILPSNDDSLLVMGVVPALTIVFCAAKLCRWYADRMDAAFLEATGIVPVRSWMARLADRSVARWQHFIAARAGSATMVSASLVLLTLALAVGVGSCGRAVSGYEFVATPLTPGEVIDGTGDSGKSFVIWPPTYFLREDTPQPKDWSPLAKATVVVDNTAGYVAYVTLLAAAALAVTLLLVRRIRPRAPSASAFRVLSRVVYLAACFVLADVTWALSSWRLRSILLALVFPIIVVALWPGSAGPRRARVRRIVRPIALSAFAATQIFWGLFGLAMAPGEFGGLSVLLLAPMVLAQGLGLLAAAPVWTAVPEGIPAVAPPLGAVVSAESS